MLANRAFQHRRSLGGPASARSSCAALGAVAPMRVGARGALSGASARYKGGPRTEGIGPRWRPSARCA
eukprot:7953019-Alexandrium_andersonii.AAC.1